MPLTELDQREVFGTGAIVTLWRVDDHCFRVELDAAGFDRAQWETDDGREAVDIFRHTFARQDAPDLFRVSA